MNLSSKKILFIDLEKYSAEVKTFPDLHNYIGGLALALKILESYRTLDPIIFAVGPLNGFFPYASKTAIVLEKDGAAEDIYVGGYLSTRIRFADLDAILIYGKADNNVIINIENDEVTFKDSDVDKGTLGLPGKRSILINKDKEYILDEYFKTPEDLLYKKLKKHNIFGIAVTGTKVFTPKNYTKYEELYKALLEKAADLKVEKGFFPSCSGCPMGCEKSKTGEIGGNILVHSLVGCDFAEKIYSDVGSVFSCLNVLGYDYTHEDIENLPILIQNSLRNLSE